MRALRINDWRGWALTRALTAWLSFAGDASLAVRLVVWSLATGFTITAFCWPYLGGTFEYPEFVLGRHSWMLENKMRDIQAYQVLLAACAASYLFASGLLGYADARGRLHKSAMRELIDLSLLLLAPWIGLFLAGDADLSPFAWQLGAVWSGLMMLVVAVKRSDSLPEQDVALMARGFGAVVFAFFSGLGMALVFNVLGYAGSGVDRWLMRALAFVPAVLVMGMVLWSWWRELDPVRLYQRTAKIALLAQIGMPLLFISVLPPIVYVGGRDVEMPVPWRLVGLVMFTVGIGIVALVRRYLWACTNAGASGTSVLSSWSLTALAVFMVAGRAQFAFLWSDDFHLGDELIPWQQIFQHGKIPYVDFFLFHGFMHLVAGFLNTFFFQNDLAGHYFTRTLLYVVPAIATIFLIHRLAGTRVALFCAVFISPVSFYMGRMVWLVPSLLVLGLPALLRRPLGWLLVWVAVCAWSVLYNAVAGGAVGLATLPFALWQVWRAWGQARVPILVVGAGGLCVGLILLGVPITRNMLIGYLEFMQENRIGYEVIRGISMTESHDQLPRATGLFSVPFFFEALRLAWIGAMIGLSAIFVRGASSDRSRVNATSLYLLSSSLLALHSLVIYTLNRLDAGSLSRSGGVSYLALSALIPLGLAIFLPKFRTAHLLPVALVLGLYGGFFGFADRLSPVTLFWRAFRQVEVPPSMVYIEHDDQLKFMDHVAVYPERLETLRAFSTLINQLVPPGTTYYDLTNRKLFYYATNKPVPTRYDAEASAVNSVQQKKIVERLVEDPPPVVFVSPLAPTDHRSNLRSYHIFKHVLLNYLPVKKEPFTFMVNRQSPGFGEVMEKRAGIEELGRIFSYYDLENVPYAWGLSWHTLEFQSQLIATVSPTNIASGGGTRTEWDIPVPPAIRFGRDADLLGITMVCTSVVPESTGELTWTSTTGGPVQPVSFVVHSGRHLLPLGAFPEWLLAEQPQQITLTLPAGCRINQVEWRLRTDGPVATVTDNR